MTVPSDGRFCDDRIALVTGAAQGIGRAHAVALARAGACVVVNDLPARSSDDASAEAVAEEIRRVGGDAIAVDADIADWDQAGAVVDAAVSRWGRLDVLVANAGNLRVQSVAAMTVDDLDAVLRVNLRGMFCPLRHAIDHWQRRHHAGLLVDARIITTTSAAGLAGVVGHAGYGAAKAGVAALTRVAAVELRQLGVTVNSISPSARTRMTETAFVNATWLEHTGGVDPRDPAHVARLVVWLASPESRDVTGEVFWVAGGEIAVMEGWRQGPASDQTGASGDDGFGAVIRDLVARAVPGDPVHDVPVHRAEVG